jgi:hypothetical protein
MLTNVNRCYAGLWAAGFLLLGLPGQASAYTVASSCPNFTDITAPYVEATSGSTSNPFAAAGVASGRHTLITAQGKDPNTGGGLSLLPLGEAQVVRLGNEQVGAQAEALTYHFVVDKDHPVLLLKFAVVLQDPGHDVRGQPRFVVRIMDGNGHLTESCAEYDVSAGANIPGFQSSGSGWSPVRWRDWTSVGLDLSPHIGSEVQVQLVTYDCAYSAHFGYAYFTASCISNVLQLDDCNAGQFTALAPDNFASYLWDNGDQTRASTRSAAAAGNLSCYVTSATGCNFTLSGYVAGTAIPQSPFILDTVCEGDPYTRNYLNLPPQLEAGTKSYYNSLLNLATCSNEQTTEVALTVLPRYHHVKATICSNDSYTEHGFDIRQPAVGVRRDTLRKASMVGNMPCDSIICLELAVNASLDMPNAIYGDPAPCTGEPVTYSFAGNESLQAFGWQLPANATAVSGMGTPQLTLYFTDDTPGTLVLTGANGCGNGATPLAVHPRQRYNVFFTDTVCTGADYSKHDFYLGAQRQPGYFVHTHRYATALGCDSTITLALTVLPTPEVSVVVQGDSLLCGRGQSVKLTAVGNDVPFDLSDLKSDTSLMYVHDCSLSYLWSTGSSDASITASPAATATYSVTVTNSAGCTSAAASQTVVVSAASDPQAIYDTICEGSTYAQLGFSENTTGTYSTTITQNSCSVPLTLHLTVNPTRRTTIRDTVCKGATYTGHGFNVTPYDTGSLSQTLTYASQTGCDSVVTLALYVQPVPATALSDAVCQGAPYAKHGFSLSEQDNAVAGLHTHTKRYASRRGCDSLVVLSLTVNPCYALVISDEAPVGELYEKYGFSFTPTATGAVSRKLSLSTAAASCDSTVTLNLNAVCSVTVTELSDTICQNEAYARNGFSLPAQAVSGLFTDTMKYSSSIAGCDSVVTLRLTVNPTYNLTRSVTICGNELPCTLADSIFGVGTPSGRYTLRRATAAGCDSIVTVQLTVMPTYHHRDSVEICANDLPYTHANATFDAGTASGVYPLRFKSVSGCDSIVDLHLTVNPAYSLTHSVTICGSQLPYTFADTTFEAGTPSGSYTLRRATAAVGCDSIVTVHLTVNPTYNLTRSVTICDNQLPYTLADSTFEAGTPSGSYTLRRATAAGCDSIVTVQLTVVSVYHHRDSAEICTNDLPYTHANATFDVGTASGVYPLRFKSVSGCDSIVDLHLTVNASPQLTVVSPSACANDTEVTVELNVEQGLPTRYSLAFSKAQSFFADVDAAPLPVAIPLPAGIRPDVYGASITLADDKCSSHPQPLSITVQYAASIMQQKWNNVIALYNQRLNGGYEFAAYQWLKNGAALPGATRPYLYSPPELDFTAGYSVLLTRTDGVTLPTCPLFPQRRDSEDIAAYPTIVDKGGHLTITSVQQGEAIIRNILGAVVSRQKLNAGAASVAAPGEAGVYFVEVYATGENPKVIKILVK